MKKPVFILALSLLASPAAAQRATETDTGSHLAVPMRARIPDYVDNIDAGRIAMAEFARCTLDRAPARTEAALRKPLGVPVYWKAMTELADSECLASGSMRFKPVLLRGSLFTELWRRRTIAENKGVRWGPVFDLIDWTSVKASDPEEAKQNAALLWFAHCVVQRDPAAASDAIVSPIASKSQTAAYQRLQPHLAPCLDAGSSIKLSKPVLEGAIAEVLYRGVAPTVAAPAGTK